MLRMGRNERDAVQAHIGAAFCCGWRKSAPVEHTVL